MAWLTLAHRAIMVMDLGRAIQGGGYEHIIGFAPVKVVILQEGQVCTHHKVDLLSHLYIEFLGQADALLE